MTTFASSHSAGLSIQCNGSHWRPPSVQVDTAAGNAIPVRSSDHWHHVVLQRYSSDRPIETLYAMADDHCLRYLSNAFRDNRISARFFIPRLKSKTELLSLCPTLQVLSATNKLDDATFPRSGKAQIAIIIQDLGFGDCLALFSVLKEVEFRLRRRGLTLRVGVFANFCSPVRSIFRLSSIIAEVHLMPQPLTTFASYGAVIDLNNVRFSCDRSLVDSMLEAATIDPTDVPLERKRVVIDRIPQPSGRLRLLVEKARQKYRRLVVLSPIATGPTRCMPLSAMSRLRAALNKYEDWLVITAHPGLVPQGFADWSYVSRTFSEFVSLVSMCDAVISVDTSTVHVADALNKRAVVLFTTNAAHISTAAYPKALPIQVGRIGPLGGTHRSLEPDLIRYAEAQWDHVNFDRIVDCLACTLHQDEGVHAQLAGDSAASSQD
jgi:hypothetical protein